MKVALSTDQVAYCIRVGRERQRTNVNNRIQSKQFTQRDPTTIHVQGVLAEYAFGRLCESELKVDLKVEEVLNDTRSRGASFDWTLNKKTVDVKSTLWNSKLIYSPTHKRFHPADFYVLMFLEVPFGGTNDDKINSIMARPQPLTVHFQGFTGKENMFARALATTSTAQVNPSWDEFLAQIPVKET